MHHKNPTQVFLVIHPGTLGDVVLAFPAIQAIRCRFLDHELGLLVRESIILTGLPSKVLIKASSGGGTKFFEVSTILDIMIFPAPSSK